MTGATCDGHADLCAPLVALAAAYTAQRAEAGIAGAAVVQAMAVGLVLDVWRNGPVEDMHAGRRGPSDAVMFAESTALHDVAVAALLADNRAFGLIGFERHVLDRTRPWAGGDGRTLKDFGHGHLGAHERHVRRRTNTLMSLDDHTCVDDALEIHLVSVALMYGHDHKGMPKWPVIVDRIGALLSDPQHPAWRDPARGAQALAEMPAAVTSVGWLQATLLEQPSTLPPEVLTWLSHHLLYCAAPPYSPMSWAA